MKNTKWVPTRLWVNGNRWELYVDGEYLGRVLHWPGDPIEAHTAVISGSVYRDGFEDLRDAARWLMKQAGVW